MKLWRGQPDNWKYRPTSRDIAYAWLGIGISSAVLSLYSFLHPQISFTGRWAWLQQLFFNLVGPNGVAVLFLVIGTAFIAATIAKLKSQN